MSEGRDTETKPLAFLKGFLRNPRGVGSVWPSSRFLAQRVVDAGAAGSARTVVELGPGTGAVTRQLLANLPAEGRLVALEISAEFIELLEREISDPRLSLYHGPSTEIASALSEFGLDSADLVVSGIPFSTLEKPIARRTLEAVRAALAPGGRFVAYQLRDTVVTRARPIFGEPEAETELLNLPPMRVYTWHRDGNFHGDGDGHHGNGGGGRNRPA